MERITYIAPNLMDWVAQIQAGSATVKVHFTGGAITSYGVTPAEYTTENVFVQRVIERSSYYKDGRIQVGRRVEIKGEKNRAKALSQNGGDLGLSPSAQLEGETENGGDLGLSPSAQLEGETEGETEDGLREVEVSCLQDALGFLQREYKIATYKIRSYGAAQRAAAEHGVVFVGSGFRAEGRMQSEGTSASASAQ